MPRSLDIKQVVFFLLLILATNLSLTGQNVVNDWKLIQSKNFHQQGHKQDVSFMIMDQRSKIVKYNPVSLVFGGMLYIYQKLISHQLSAGCRFYPSCSAFSKQAIQEFGLVKGIALSADRLARCNRVAATSYHPVRLDKKSGKIKETMDIFYWHEKE